MQRVDESIVETVGKGLRVLDYFSYDPGQGMKMRTAKASSPTRAPDALWIDK